MQTLSSADEIDNVARPWSITMHFTAVFRSPPEKWQMHFYISSADSVWRNVARGCVYAFSAQTTTSKCITPFPCDSTAFMSILEHVRRSAEVYSFKIRTR